MGPAPEPAVAERTLQPRSGAGVQPAHGPPSPLLLHLPAVPHTPPGGDPAQRYYRIGFKATTHRTNFVGRFASVNEVRLFNLADSNTDMGGTHLQDGRFQRPHQIDSTADFLADADFRFGVGLPLCELLSK